MFAHSIFETTTASSRQDRRAGLRTFLLAGGLALAMAAPADSALAGSFSVLHSFANSPDGATPIASLLRDSAGNLYGTTFTGGTGTNCGGAGCGTVFKIASDGTETVLYNFQGGNDGEGPYSSLIEDSKGNLYGTTLRGGGGNPTCGDGCGIVFKIAPDGTETILNAFVDGSDGAFPQGDLAMDAKGNLYGTTIQGGANNMGTVFENSPTGNETVLYSFTGGSDGAFPMAGVMADTKGNLYGTASAGAKAYGTVFTLKRAQGAWNLKVLHAFAGGKKDGGGPEAGLIADAAGNLYGTTQNDGANGEGTVFKVTPNGSESVLHAFLKGKSDGNNPVGSLVADGVGDLYGTTQYSGAHNLGVVFKLAPDGTETILHSFAGGASDGANPYAGMIADNKGHLYGTTYAGGASNMGTVFRINE